LQSKVTLTCAVSAVVLVAFSACLGQGTQVAGQRQADAWPGAPAPPAAAPISLPEIVRRLTEAQLLIHQSEHSYTVVREYELLSGKKAEPSSVTAEVDVVASGVKGYTILSTQGGGSGEHVVRRILEREAEIAPAWRQTALSEENYSFQLLGQESVDGHECFVLGLAPRRNSGDLLRGRAWVDATSFNVRRVEGTPAKSPSWWVKRLEINLQFSQVLGMWLQTAITARAEIRFLGDHVFTGRDVQVRMAEANDNAMQQQERGHPSGGPAPNARTSSHAMVGAGVISLP
jgi:hypothetical protein